MASAAGKLLKAGAIFSLALVVAFALSLGFAALTPPAECDLPIAFTLQSVEGGLQATITAVNGEFPADQVGYEVVELTDASSQVVASGNITDVGGAVVYQPADSTAGILQEGDILTIVTPQVSAQLLLVDGNGTALGWSMGCEG